MGNRKNTVMPHLRDGQGKWRCTYKFHEGQAQGQLQPFLASALDAAELSTALTLATNPLLLLGVRHSQSRHLGGTKNPSFLPENKPPDHAACRLDTTLIQLSQLTAYQMIGTLLGFYAVQNASFLTTFRIPSSRVTDSWRGGWWIVPKRLQETSILCVVKSQNSADIIYATEEACRHGYWKKFLIFGWDILFGHTNSKGVSCNCKLSLDTDKICGESALTTHYS